MPIDPRRAIARAILMAAILLGPTPSADAMDLGTNFWNPGWHKPDDCFQDVGNVTGDDPWNPRFLEEIAIFRSFRFMDWDHTNGSKRASWTERPRKDAPKQNPVAYEWMIDLCNRMNADLWVTVPHRTVSRHTGNRPCDYALRLCILVKTGVDMGDVSLVPLESKLGGATVQDLVKIGGRKTGVPLKPNLRFYIEYSNETWNGVFKQSHYCCDEGSAIGLDPRNKWTAGFRYHAWAAIRLFHAADLVFGAGSKRVVRVLATHSANPWIAGQHLKVIGDPARNPWGVKADAIATAPYFGHMIHGDSPDAVARLREAIRKSAEQSARHRKLADEAGLMLIAYEGGQHITKKAKTINTNPAMYDLYAEYLRAMSTSFFHFSHYCHVGRAGDGGAWGALEHTGQPPDRAPKYRALVAWSKSRAGR
jgi:hypothetical protein